MTQPAPDQRGTKGSSAVQVEWHDAPARIRALIERAGQAAGRPMLVGISGPVASGKSTLARLVSPCIVATDNYLPDYDITPNHERDEPRNADFPRLARDLESLRAGRTTAIPTWSFHSHKREGERPMSPDEIVVCEGIHALYDTVAHLYDLAVFVESPKSLRLSRMEDRERSGARGWGVETARAFFHNVAEPTFDRFADAYRARAHIIVVNNEPRTK
jgi:uridine kinase